MTASLSASTEPARAPLLHAVAVEKRFGGLTAVDSCTIEVGQGSIVGLIGPNGAGKTTLFNVISGFFRPDGGRIFFGGNRIDGLRPHEVYRMGLARTFQTPRELRDMTVLENMMLYPKTQLGEWIWRPFLSPGRVRRQEQESRDKAESLLEFVNLIALKDELAKNLSGGQKKLLELARVLMGDPDMILLDEPGAGVNPTLMQRLSQSILELRDRGKTFLLVEHDMDLITALCDRVVVMAKGQVLAEGTFEDIRQDAQVLEAYLAG